MAADGASRPSAEGLQVSVVEPPSSFVCGAMPEQYDWQTNNWLFRSRAVHRGGGGGWVPPRGGSQRCRGSLGRCGGCGGGGDVRAGGHVGGARLRVLKGTRGCEAIWEPAVEWRGAKVIWDTGRSVWCCVVWRGGLLFPRQARACGKHGAGRRGGALPPPPRFPCYRSSESWDEGGARLKHHSW